MRLTKHRKRIWDLFEAEGDHLLNADMIFQRLQGEGMDLSTVYRTLDVFLKEGHIYKSMIENTAYYYLTQGEHHHYMICTRCHKKYKIKCFFDDLIGDTNAFEDFVPTHHDLTIYGYCKQCQKQEE